MRTRFIFAFVVLAATAVVAQHVVDRIVATVEGDVVTLSEVRELGAFNRLTGQAQLTDDQLLERLINQWIVTTEAAAARFPMTPSDQVEGVYKHLVAESPSPEAYLARLRELDLDEAAVRRQLARQLFLARYLDQKFRFLVRVEEAAIETYYRETLSPQLAARGQTAPRLETVRQQILEVLTQQEITRMAEQWLEESRARLRVERRGERRAS